MVKSKQTRGFTVVELLIVIIIIAILATLSIVAYNGVQNKAKISVIESDLSGAAKQLSIYEVQNSLGYYPQNLSIANIVPGTGITYDYRYKSSDNSYCLSATNGSLVYKISSSNTVPTEGDCSTGIPDGYESATVASGANISVGGYGAIQPSSCPASGGVWSKVPGNTLYDEPNGFCVQRYAASSVGGVATSQATGNRWTIVTLSNSITNAAAVTSGSHLLTENEWMTIAANAAMQPQNWSGGSVGNGTLPKGSTSSVFGGVALLLSNGETVNFDTGNGSYYASNEWTCYTGTSASNCTLAAQLHPIQNNYFYTDQFGLFSGYGSLPTDGTYYYGDPRYANSSLGAFVTAARNNGLGYIRSSYAAGSSTPFNFTRGSWTGATSSGMFSLNIYTISTYSHSTYGFRAAF